MKRSFRMLVTIGTALTLLTAACGSDDEGGSASTVEPVASSPSSEPADTSATQTTGPSATEPAASTTEAPAAVDKDAEFRFAINYGYSSLDPHRSFSPGGDEAWLKPIYDTLLNIESSPEGAKLAPQLATSFEVSDDGLTVSFELRDDVKFQDGTPFDAAAVKANIERALGPDSTIKTQIAAIQSVEVVDATHVVFHLSKPDGSVPWAMAANVTGSMISPAAFSTDLNATPVGTGPFKLVSAQQGADVVYERFDGYWDQGAVLVKKLTISTVPDANARFNGLRSGTYDAAFVTTAQSVSTDLKGEGYHVIQQEVPSPFGVLLNAKIAPFDNVLVRRAVSAALNREEISKALLDGIAPPAYQPFSRAVLGYDTALDVDPYDPDAARALIKEAGAEGAKVTIIQVQTPPIDSMAEVVQQALTDIGLEVELLPLAFADARAAWTTGNNQAIVTGFRGGYEPSQVVNNVFLSSDNPAPPPAELLALVDAAKALPFQSAEQKKAYQEVSRWLVENPIHVPITRTVHVLVAAPDVVGAEHLMTYSISRFDVRYAGIAA